jgi:hypothetical protein
LSLEQLPANLRLVSSTDPFDELRGMRSSTMRPARGDGSHISLAASRASSTFRYKRHASGSAAAVPCTIVARRQNRWYALSRAVTARRPASLAAGNSSSRPSS